INRAAAGLRTQRFEIAAESFRHLIERRSKTPYLEGNLLHARMRCCDWRGFEGLKSRLPGGVAAGGRGILPVHLLPISNSSADELQAAKIFVGDTLPYRRVDTRRRYQHDRIRVAYVSSDFHAHATAFLIAELIERHDRTRFEIFGLSLGPDDASDMRA